MTRRVSAYMFLATTRACRRRLTGAPWCRPPWWSAPPIAMQAGAKLSSTQPAPPPVSARCRECVSGTSTVWLGPGRSATRPCPGPAACSTRAAPAHRPADSGDPSLVTRRLDAVGHDSMARAVHRAAGRSDHHRRPTRYHPPGRGRHPARVRASAVAWVRCAATRRSPPTWSSSPTRRALCTVGTTEFVRRSRTMACTRNRFGELGLFGCVQGVWSQNGPRHARRLLVSVC